MKRQRHTALLPCLIRQQRRVGLYCILLLLLCSMLLLSCDIKENINKEDKETTVEQMSSENTTEAEATAFADGYTAYENGVYTVNQKFTLTFPKDVYAAEFNRFTLAYTSTEPLSCNVIYKENGTEKIDSFFLEAGTNTFRCLTEHYLQKKMGTDLTCIEINTCTGKNAQFSLEALTTEVYEVYDGSTHYLENDRFKVGIRLMWGGGINYIEDKQNTIVDLTNLVNQCDTGRLIQQSYYGTGANGEYTPGTFNNSTWSYNPVQGGDQYQNHSRLIDVVVNENSVYIKSQPQDWSLNNQITPSYMENTYMVYEDRIQVDNRFVDFSGWEHPCSTQELPAFYTVSYLDTFTFYNGVKPWTGDSLSSRDNLQFWGDSKYASDCTFYIRESNTETWCAWTNENDQYGIGLYVPNIDELFAGRHAYNRSKDPFNGACNYVAPVNRKQIVSYQPIAYSYLITTGSVDAIRSIFTEHKDFAQNEMLHENYTSMRIADDTPEKPEKMNMNMTEIDFTKPESYFHIKGTNHTSVSYDEEEGALKLTAVRGEDVQSLLEYRNSKPSLKAEFYSTISVTYKIVTDQSADNYSCELFLCTGEQQGAAAGMSVTGDYIADGEYHTLTFDVSDLDFWYGKINAIRFDYFNSCADGDYIYLKSIQLS